MRTDKCLFLGIKIIIGTFSLFLIATLKTFGQIPFPCNSNNESCINASLGEFTMGSIQTFTGYEDIGNTDLFCNYQAITNPFGVQVVLEDTSGVTNLAWSFNTPSTDNFEVLNPSNIPDTIFITAQYNLNNVSTICRCIVVLNEPDVPEANDITISLCDDDTTFEGFDVNSINTDDISTDSDNISYYLSEDFAESGNNPIVTPIDVSLGNEIFARVETNNSDCFSISTIEFVVNTNPIPTITTDNNMLDCTDNDAVITADPGFSNYDWSVTNGGTLSGSGNTQTLTVDESGDYNVMLTVTDANQCMGTATLDEDIVAVFDAPQFGNTPITTTPSGVNEIGCANPTIELMVNVSAATDNLSYQWSINGTPIMNSDSDALEISSDGNYSVVVTNSDNGCSTAPANITITNAMDQPEPVTSIAHNCDDGTVDIIGSASMTGMGAAYSWAATAGGMIDGNPNQEDITATSAGTYVLTITQGTCMVVSDPVVISAVGNPTVSNDTLQSCIVDGVGTFDLEQTNVTTTPDTTITYYENLSDAQAGNNNIINNTTAYEIDETTTIYARVERTDNGCHAVSAVTLELENLRPTTITFDPPLNAASTLCGTNHIITASPDSIIADYTYVWEVNNSDESVNAGDACTALEITGISNISLIYQLGECSQEVTETIMLDASTATDAKVLQFANTNTLFCNRNDFDSYQWGSESKSSFCPEIMDGERFQDVVITSGLDTMAFHYWVIVTDSTGCTSKIYLEGNSPFPKLAQNPTIEYGDLALQINPNPNNGIFELTVTGDEIRDLDIHVYDALGRAIYHQDAPKWNSIETFYIAVPNLTQGLYFVRVTGNDGILLTEKIIVK